ncbi:hypothetical protein [Pseudorhodobacter sp.]|uniref:hypothetical protein n=1 Tax=Pseudorhodobacter sp. TaxID=1934400 RepID=UPI00264727A5|nr:hypothetical protein [Pseudorhodobacter sp.]MDN5785618.1 hypothetical protein [Pseudorhodobacter sp.]
MVQENQSTVTKGKATRRSRTPAPRAPTGVLFQAILAEAGPTSADFVFDPAGEKALLIQVIDRSDDLQMARTLRLVEMMASRGWQCLTISLDRFSSASVRPVLAVVQTLDDEGFFARFEQVTVLGLLKGAALAQKLAALIPQAEALLLSPSTDITHSGEGKAWLIRDPFLRGKDRTAVGVRPLKAIGMGDNPTVFLERTGMLERLLELSLTRNLTEPAFYSMIRDRRVVRLYRIVMTEHLENRGQTTRATRFTRAFMQNARQVRHEAEVAAQVVAAAEPVVTTRATVAARPRTLGNVWHLENREGVFLYLSDQYRGQVMGFEERAGVTLGQTPEVAIGMVSIGGPGVLRPLPERFDYHLTDETLSCDTASHGAEAHGVLTLMASRSLHRAWRSTIAISEPQSGMMLDEAGLNGEIVIRVLHRIAQARDKLAEWGKHLFIDRVCVDLLAGSAHSPEAVLTTAYPRLIADLRHAVAVAAKQNSLPTMVVSQSCGGRTDGRSNLMLAEGRLDVMNAGLGLVLATPTYPFRLMPDTVATLLPQDRLLVDELEALAVAEVQQGRPWYCPTLRQVFQSGDNLIADFATLTALELAEGPHGFGLEGCTNDARIVSVTASGERVVLQLDRVPEGRGMMLAYAWGHRRDTATDDRPANHGALREVWQGQSLIAPDRPLRRYALAARLPVMPSDQS